MRLRLFFVGICTGCFLLGYSPPRSTATSSSIVISEFRTRGPNGGNDEFIELFNYASVPVGIGGWQIKGSSGTGTVSPRANINTGVVLNPGCHYLLTNSSPSGGPFSGPAGDQTYGVGIADDGGIALTMPDGTIVDQVGMSAGSVFKEGSHLDPLGSNSNQSYERRPGGLAGSSQDTDNNRSDFRLLSPSDPQRASSACQSAGTPSNPSGIGLAAPSSLPAGSATLLTVSVSPGSNPVSTGIAVRGDLSSIGGSSLQSFFNDGTNGDAAAGDSTFSFEATLGLIVGTGSKTLSLTITDTQGRSSLTSITLTVESSGSAACGVERWSIKTGTDVEALLVDTNTVIPTTILEMQAWASPSPIPPSTRVAPNERSVYVVSGILTDYKLEDDSDYHLVIRDESGNSIITEIPCPCCVAASSPFLAKVTLARHNFNTRFTARDSFQNTNVPLVISGVGFFDFKHGQRGLAPNGIELHPVLDLTFDADLGTPIIIGAMINGKKLIISGLNFDDGAVLLLEGDKQKTRNNEDSPTTGLICKKAGRNITPGTTVKLQVRNSNGQLSGEYSLMRALSLVEGRMLVVQTPAF